MIVWEGTYTEEDGTVIDAVIKIDGDKLARWLGVSRHNYSAFKQARNRAIVIERLAGGIIVSLRRGEHVGEQDVTVRENDEMQRAALMVKS